MLENSSQLVFLWMKLFSSPAPGVIHTMRSHRKSVEKTISLVYIESLTNHTLFVWFTCYNKSMLILPFSFSLSLMFAFAQLVASTSSTWAWWMFYNIVWRKLKQWCAVPTWKWRLKEESSERGGQLMVMMNIKWRGFLRTCKFAWSSFAIVMINFYLNFPESMMNGLNVLKTPTNQRSSSWTMCRSRRWLQLSESLWKITSGSLRKVRQA